MSGKKKTKKPPIDNATVLERLERARDGQLLMSIRRWIPYSERLDGFVTGIGTDWIAVAQHRDSGSYDGWCVVRLKDIQAVRIEPDQDCFEIRALKAWEQWPPPAVALDLDGLGGLVASANEIRPIISVFTEFDRPDSCWIGAVRSLEADTLRLSEITVKAAWEGEPRHFDVEDITRIDIGGGYEDSLLLVAGPPPED
ncbi:hypothetical protein [Propionicimonas sp.]|uniref:hypothetical protein n=1 Tax=Propionicimonas sp. TaxID=1955623 RepID=UPI0018504CC8|nr:hypothetical protein [Propionicimonas sp.]MBU3977852.1 hypothetical protein [Actinomycetota bacterium]MBA3021924.1 hypothetical protein [Propionicimonas sp.]MBU3987629.1 hypothetical protein [Actinomycetota bacterium]MBU4007351.1 hypothetical protein [Actinomycetota bacterium]MBU4065703.1 hypothetical protein [Actinomycetota bacterium]